MFTRTAAVALLSLGVAFVALPGEAYGGILASDTNALGFPYRNSVTYDLAYITYHVKANVDFAVYEPGKFELTFPGQDPSGGDEYVYAYQIIEVLEEDVTGFTVGLDGDEPLGSVTFLAGTGLAPNTTNSPPRFVGTPPTSVRWDFTPTHLTAANDPSAILIFTSEAPPELDSSTVKGLVIGAQRDDIPSPLPEPTSLALLALGSVLLCTRRRHNGKSA